MRRRDLFKRILKLLTDLNFERWCILCCPFSLSQVYEILRRTACSQTCQTMGMFLETQVLTFSFMFH